jgi:uncharacterized protein (TIGR00369 family)
MPILPEREAQVRQSFSRSNLMQAYGTVLTTVDKGYIELELPAKEMLLRTSGMFHGGVLAAIADTGGGYAAASAKDYDPYFVTVEFKINFLSQASGERLIVRSRVIRSGRTMSIVQSDIYSVAGDAESHAAMAVLTFMEVRRGREQAKP